MNCPLVHAKPERSFPLRLPPTPLVVEAVVTSPLHLALETTRLCRQSVVLDQLCPSKYMGCLRHPYTQGGSKYMGCLRHPYTQGGSKYMGCLRHPYTQGGSKYMGCLRHPYTQGATPIPRADPNIWDVCATPIPRADPNIWDVCATPIPRADPAGETPKLSKQNMLVSVYYH